MKPEKKFMQIAIDEAMEGITHGHGGPFGTAIVKDGVLIASGHNQSCLELFDKYRKIQHKTY